jgi:hypothetical protein
MRQFQGWAMVPATAAKSGAVRAGRYFHQLGCNFNQIQHVGEISVERSVATCDRTSGVCSVTYT